MVILYYIVLTFIKGIHCIFSPDISPKLSIGLPFSCKWYVKTTTLWSNGRFSTLKETFLNSDIHTVYEVVITLDFLNYNCGLLLRILYSRLSRVYNCFICWIRNNFEDTTAQAGRTHSIARCVVISCLTLYMPHNWRMQSVTRAWPDWY